MSIPFGRSGDPMSERRVTPPSLIVFDVNETLSDMSPLVERFAEVGAPGHLAKTWFAGLLRDGFALAAAGATAPFAEIGAGLLRVSLAEHPLNRNLPDAVEHIMDGFGGLDVHPDVVGGVRALSEQAIRLVTLTNGSTSVAAGLFERAGILHRFERLLSVEDAGRWKPAAASYAYALAECGVGPSEAMLVAVHPWDIDGASRAGLATAWLNRTNSPYPEYFRRANLQPTSLIHLAQLLS